MSMMQFIKQVKKQSDSSSESEDGTDDKVNGGKKGASNKKTKDAPKDLVRPRRTRYKTRRLDKNRKAGTISEGVREAEKQERGVRKASATRRQRQQTRD